MFGAPSNGYYIPETDISGSSGSVRLDQALAPDVFNGSPALYFNYPRTVPQEEEGKSAIFWQQMRIFFRTGRGGGLPRQSGLKPALLAPYYRSRSLGGTYPIWIPDQETLSGAVFQEGQSWTVTQLLEAAVQRFASGDDEAVLLKANLSRAARIVSMKLEESGGALAAGSLWDESFQELQKELQVKGVEGLILSSDLSKLRRTLPTGGVCIPFSPYAPFYLLSGVLDQVFQQRITKVESRCRELVPRLRALIARLQAGNWKMGTAEESVVWQQRLESALEVIERAALQIGQRSALLLVGREFQEMTSIHWEKHFPRCDVQVVEGDKIFEVAQRGVEEAVAGLAVLVSSLRTAVAALENRDGQAGYWASSGQLEWSLFTEEEKSLLPPVCLLLDTGTLAGRAMGAFTACIREDYPIKIISSPVWPGPGQAEIAAAATVQQNAFVCQATALQPKALLGELAEGIAFHGPAFFQVYGHGFPSGPGGAIAYLHTCAAVEARVFPVFCYNPSKGEFWGSRFELTFNPDSGRDWPMHDLPARQGKELLTLSTEWTFVDFLSSSPAFDSGFMVVPPEYWGDDLVPLEAFPASLEGVDGSRVPFIWMADDTLNLYKVAVAWPLIRQYYRCRDIWRYYQENAGVNNFHVNRAAADFTRQLQQQASQDTPEARQARDLSLQAFAETAVREAMGRLATALLGNDITALPAVEKILTENPAAAVQEPSKAEAIIDEHEVPASVEQAEVAVQTVDVPEVRPAPQTMEVEAWIETPMCTSCSECVDNYPQVFSYNGDKQAYVAAPRGGSFADIVLAAERCPVHIIHPGTPWDTGDPGLAEWIGRARPFQ